MDTIDKILLNRRTIRKYTQDPVGDDLLAGLLDSCMQGLYNRQYAGLQYYHNQG